MTETLLRALLESWDRDCQITLNLLNLIPPAALVSRATPDGPTVAQQFHHLHRERMISVAEEAPEFSGAVPEHEWTPDLGHQELNALLTRSAQVVREAVEGRIRAGQDLDLNYGHPLLMLQLLLWHDGYHHGQIKLALKIAGHPVSDDDAGPLTWDIWRQRQDPA